jgi:23S rRNA pseudouridine2605 synthase
LPPPTTPKRLVRERIQKTLAARGVGSRRQVEAWIRAGRITVNGKLATPGLAVGGRDDVRLDGRRLRLSRDSEREHEGIVYHRPAQEDIRAGATGTMPSSIERLPKSAGRRWIAISPLAANDGGLELFVTDGHLAAALTRRGIGIPSEFSVRVRGAFDESAISALLVAAASEISAKGRVTAVVPSGGEGSNRWLQVHCIGLRPRDLRQLFEHCGLEANRILRTRFGPIAMDRALARGRNRPLTETELKALQDAAESRPTAGRSPAR